MRCLINRDDANELLEGDLRRYVLFLVKTQKKKTLAQTDKDQFCDVWFASAFSSKKSFKTLQIGLEWI